MGPLRSSAVSKFAAFSRRETTQIVQLDMRLYTVDNERIPVTCAGFWFPRSCVGTHAVRRSASRSTPRRRASQRAFPRRSVGTRRAGTGMHPGQEDSVVVGKAVKTLHDFRLVARWHE